MKKLALIATAALMTAPAFADDVFGTWKTAKDDNGNFGHIAVAQCGDTICGKLVKSFNPDGSELKSDNVGKNIIWNMTNQGDGYYAGGKVWSPDRDKTYKSKMQLSGNTLAIKGCIGPICRDGGKWTRVK
ncbi:DUF2147 domain-containing protein [Amylibacter sp. SFDW26]|uniref:DUF2147 domain-containing protein n=1 Tax=Amylibacter sp. SFDW26 TaxID=2652722 RepID=UPI001262900A|nr:DUF2147 domain-containing protein [Amylibacter sp. SFDW26]KAB7615461.1 DUF2147 domain-containing protein [Amylibacter sp. SFDW26]